MDEHRTARWNTLCEVAARSFDRLLEPGKLKFTAAEYIKALTVEHEMTPASDAMVSIWEESDWSDEPTSDMI